MTEKLQVYKCMVCGNMAEMVHGGAGELICCGQPMVLLKENSTDAAKEKHVPVIEKIPDGILVRVGSVAHPMEEKHYIEWIEVIEGGKSCRQFLKPGDKPEAVFSVKPDNIQVREYCNIHGLWRN